MPWCRPPRSGGFTWSRAALDTTNGLAGSSDGRNAVDYTVNCATGYPQMTGSPDTSGPVNHVLPAWDIAAGLMAGLSLLAALRNRDASGQGCEIRVPLSNVALATLSILGNIGEVATTGKDRPRYGNALYGSFGHDFKTADGRTLMITAITKRQWLGLVEALGLHAEVKALEQTLGADFASDEGARFANRDPLFAIVERAIADRHFETLPSDFDSHGVCWGEYTRKIRQRSAATC